MASFGPSFPQGLSLLQHEVQVLHLPLRRSQLHQLLVQTLLGVDGALRLCRQLPLQLLIVVLQHQDLPAVGLAQVAHLLLQRFHLRLQLAQGLGELCPELLDGGLLGLLPRLELSTFALREGELLLQLSHFLL